MLRYGTHTIVCKDNKICNIDLAVKFQISMYFNPLYK